MNGDLTTLAAVRRQLSLAASQTGDDDLISDYVTQASQTIENLCKRTLVAAPGTLTLSAVAPNAYGRKLFFLQDVLGVYYAVNGNGVTLTPDQYRLLPYNFSPKYGMELTQQSGLMWTWDFDPKGCITIAGTLGMFPASAIPADLKLAATKLAAFLYQTRDNVEQVVKAADGTMILPPQINSVVMTVLERSRYIRDTLWVGEQGW